MDFDWTPEQRAARNTVAAFLDDAERARLRAAEDEGTPGLRGMTVHLQRRLAELHVFASAPVPGDESAALALLAADLELGAASASFLVAVQATRQCADLVAEHGSEKLRHGLLAALRAGERLATVALPDPGGAADGTPTATPAPGGGWILRGRRPFLAGAPIADYLAVFADAGGKTLVAVLRPGDAGVHVGNRLPLIGLHGLAAAPLELADAPVQADAVMGPFDGPAVECRVRRARDLGLAAASVGRMRAAWAAAKAHAESHRRGGKPLVARQEIAFKLAELLALTQTAELLACRAAWMVSEAGEEANVLVRCAKVFCAETGERVTSGAMSVLAGHGCVAGNDVERAWRDAKTLAAMGSTVETARMAIADELLERP
ncbi:MAG: acyl-CoA/acyl-ACP dehydrogenase [Deltaproteobacteria bacterium]|nr:acyl-CoA/acyl-ACP dehydrogenase [Deltaproteobacteria bacterium]